uniref:Sec23/Sec24 trunk domain-containing protein n=1 Tax=Ditylenchus dipsaci TaxID=166011 RepID=A0A915D045_9BILA
MDSLLEQQRAPPVIDLGGLALSAVSVARLTFVSSWNLLTVGENSVVLFADLQLPWKRDISLTWITQADVLILSIVLSSISFVATKQYRKNGVKPKEPAFIFMVDVSYNAIRNGIVELLCRNLVYLLGSLPRDYGMDKSTVKIGLATYDNVFHFYNLSQEGRPEMLVVNDVSDMFVPFAERFLVDFEQVESSLLK